MNVLQDLRFALRQLRRAPGFAATAVLTLALGIGANTAIFSLLDQALLRSLPVRDPSSLVVLETNNAVWNGSSSVNGGSEKAYFSYPMYKELRDRSQPFAGLIATAPTTVGFSRNGTSEFAGAEIVSGNYFTTLGVQPALGRLFTQADDNVPEAVPVAVVSYDFWRNRLGSEAAIVGSKVTLNGHPFQIAGVAAPRFYSAVWGEKPALFVPMSMLNQAMPGQGERLRKADNRWLNIIGRLKPGLSSAQAQADLAPLWHALRAAELKQSQNRSKRFAQAFLTDSRLLLLPGAHGFSYKRDTLEGPFLAVMAMAVLVLLIAAVNVASLLLVRSAARVREFALRSALGAQTSRVLLQLLLEGLLIGVMGGAAGLLVAPAAIRLLISRLTDLDGGTPFNTSLDPRVLAFNFGIATLVSLCFSLVPALQLIRLNLTSTLRESTGTGAGSLLLLRRVVVCLQIGFSVLLLMASGLFLRTMQHLREVNVGFTTNHLVTFSIDPQSAGYPLAAAPALDERVLRALGETSGVQSVAATSDPELANNNAMNSLVVSGYQAPPDETYPVESPYISPNYFSVLQIPLITGRVLNDADVLDHPLVAVVNQAFAKHFCGAPQACLGRRVGVGGGDNAKLDTEIVGVVRDSRHAGIREEIAGTMFRPLRQHNDASSISFYVRTISDPAQTLANIRITMHRLDPSLPLSTLVTMDQQIDDNLSNDRMIALLAVSFGVLATLLAGVGIYGVLAYTTAQRTREIGIRMALGSTRLAVSRLVLSDVLRLAIFGVVCAVPIGLLLARFLKKELFGVSANDPLTLVSVVLLIAVVAVLAAVLPARREASVEPSIALRSE